jgi:molybdopterin/thiamine biosynthesis adenylyltransferase
MLTGHERERYQHQFATIGENGQDRLKDAHVVVAGAGGLGTIIITYLAAAGVGSIRIVDADVIEEKNLNRQFLYGSEDAGRRKVEVAQEQIRQINPCVHVEAVSARIDEENVTAIVSDMDLIIDGMDNFPAR